MRATDILTEEHRIILRVLSCLRQIAENGERAGALDADDARAAIRLMRDFADRCHHSKEEELLFPVMEAHGFPRHGGPTGVMIMEHDEGRRLVGRLAESVDQAAVGEVAALRAFSSAARQLDGMLAEHIQKEDHCLFSMADGAVSDTAAATLLADFRRVEERAGGTRHAEALAGTAALCRRLGLDFDVENELATLHEEFLTAVR
ncbi:MAG: hemerythrin domain-containing protein [Candidatus Schekmanbacteria bacterium]|nr:hemerythrin domain-containing protein [Candidatus Schekmanbacteria bacterium]